MYSILYVLNIHFVTGYIAGVCSNPLAFANASANAAFAFALALDSPAADAFSLAFAFDSSAFAIAVAFDSNAFAFESNANQMRIKCEPSEIGSREIVLLLFQKNNFLRQKSYRL